MIWKRKWIVGLCFVLLVISMPYASGKKTSIYASENFSVTSKEKVNFFVGEPINAEQFNIMFGQEKISGNQILIEPKVCSQAGIHQIMFSYDTENGYYQQKLSIVVKNVIMEAIEPELKEIVLVKGQEITKEQLPAMYAIYSNGTKELVGDYTYKMDWENSMLSVCYEGISTELPVDVVDSTLQYIQVYSKKECVPADYVFRKEDMKVMAYFADGTCMEITEYQILPYTLSQGGESKIIVQYEGKTAGFFIKTVEGQQTTVENNGTDIQNSPLAPIPTSGGAEQSEFPLQSEKDTENSVVLETPFPQVVDEKSDCTKPITNMKNKVYKKNVTIIFSDKESGVQSAQLSGDWNGTIVSGYVLKKEGTYTLTIRDKEENQTVVNFSIQKPAKKVEISCRGTSLWKKIRFMAKVTGTNRAVSWKSSNTSIGTINQKGVFRAKRSGNCYIKATIDKITVKKKVQVLKKEKCVLVY